MLHDKINITYEGYTAKLYTYILDNSLEIDPDRKRPLVLILPGGGYNFTSDREAEPIAIQLNARGLHACVLRYSTAPAPYWVSLVQAAKAVALIRSKNWNIASDKFIIGGFSAGGHLAASLGVYWNTPALISEAGTDKNSLMPDGLLLCYPVIRLDQELPVDGMIINTKDLPEEIKNSNKLDANINNNTPPSYIWHTCEDGTVPVENSLLFASALNKNSIPFELHIFQKGQHGLSLGTSETATIDNNCLQPDVTGWIDTAATWIKNFK